MHYFLKGVISSVLLGVAFNVSASVESFSDRISFNTLGVIKHNSNFDDFGSSFGYPGQSFTRGDVTYNSTQNITWGSNTPYSTLNQTLIGNNLWTPVLGSINSSPKYDMFGFDIATWGNSPITITLFTNISGYIDPGLTIANSAAGQSEFRGYKASQGEYFTGFKITTDAGDRSGLPGITNVTLGNAQDIAAVPEVETYAMLLAGLGLIGFAASRQKNLITKPHATNEPNLIYLGTEERLVPLCAPS